jgi:hypothetical protein
MKKLISVCAIIIFGFQSYAQIWTVEKANKWYNRQSWVIGANYIPANAINPVEIWQAVTFSPELIDRELDYTKGPNFNTMRVFLAYLPWKGDTEGFYKQIDEFLDICKKHDIRVIMVLFDDCWNPFPKSGIQPLPVKGVHNSGWVQCPGKEILGDLNRHDELKPYVQGVLKRYSRDKCILAWDLYNEPGNNNENSYGNVELKNKSEYSLALLKKVFIWAREINPGQPLTVDVWTDGNPDISKWSPIDRLAYENSDIITFHSYMDSNGTERIINSLVPSKRPIICTEYLCRECGSTFRNILPLLKKYNIGAINWGFVSGKSQTVYPWGSWQKPFKTEPKIWFHDIFREDGTPFSQTEIDLIRSMTRN